MKRTAFVLAVYSLTLILLGAGCVGKDKEKEREARQPPEPSPPKPEEVVITPELEQKVEDLLAPARQRELTAPERQNLLAAFVDLGKPGVACLIKELKKEDLDARNVVIGILGKLGDTSAVKLLVEQFKQRAEDVRQAAAKALGEIGRLEAVPALIAALQRDKKKRVRAEAATSLGLLRSKEAVIPLIQALDPTRERKRWVRRSAAEALGLIGDLQAKEPLMNALNDRETVVRVAAMFGLYKLGDTTKLELLERRAKDQDAEEEIREWAVRELGFIAAAQSVEILAEAMKDTSAAIRLAAAEALGKIPGGESLDALIAGLQDQDATVRGAIVGSLSGRGVPPVGEGGQRLFDALAELIKNEPVESVRKKAKTLYDLIKPTLPPRPTTTPPEKPTSPASGGEAPSAEPGDAATESPSSEKQ
ncbi:HEAT repeat domain-containing protein [bacterium]|nr:HEAT repeat domain-containing protein [bacterium]